ncbi:MAG: c-type cytochrome [Wenzhouxiangellaceae bacterium]|nr:c-type cytochrome [Wenzhouxiangellaceae bacterium]
MRDPQDLRDDQWITSVSHMRVRAGLTGRQARDILAFLQDSNIRGAVEPVEFGEDTSTDAGPSSGEEIYNRTCIACHGANGKGTVPGTPDFTNPEGPLAQADEVLIRHITEGFKSPGSPMAMPPKGGNPLLSDSDIRAVLEYMRAKFQK